MIEKTFTEGTSKTFKFSGEPMSIGSFTGVMRAKGPLRIPTIEDIRQSVNNVPGLQEAWGPK